MFAKIPFIKFKLFPILKTRDKRIECLISWMGRLPDLKSWWSRVWFEEFYRKGYFEEWGYKISRKYVEDSLKYNLEKRRIK